MTENLLKNNKSGYWGQQTATIDWCEQNYEVTHYIAEFWNTVSNLVLILFPLYGLYWSWKHISYSNKFSTKDHKYFKISNTILWCHIGLIIVGIGSWMFHMTLLYSMQLLDELPMIFGSGILVYANYDILLATLKHYKQSKRSFLEESLFEKLYSNKKLIFALIFIYCFSVAYIYLYVWTNPIFHEIAYSIMTLVIVAENVTLIKKLKLSKRLYLISFIYYMFGFLLWNIDNKFCNYLKLYRDNLETVFGITNESIQSSGFRPVLLNVVVVSLKSISEFHSLWHIFTGYGAFMTILFLTEVHYEYYLLSTNSTKRQTEHKVDRPVSSKLFDMYYHLNYKLINEKSNEKKNQNSSNKK